MKRRDFVSHLALGTLAATSLTHLACNQKKKVADDDQEYYLNMPVFYTEASSLPKSGIAVGGIGCGSAELRQDGVFYNWQIANNKPRGTGANMTGMPAENLFFVVRYQTENSEPRFKVLQIDHNENLGGINSYGNVYIFPWLSGVKKVKYVGCFPFVRLEFSDPDMPFIVIMNVFSPFVPHDLKNSSIPGFYVSISIESTSRESVNITLMGTFKNLVGYDHTEKFHKSTLSKNNSWLAATFSCTELDPKASSYGDISLASLSGETSYYLGWEHLHPFYEIALRNSQLPNVDDTDARKKFNKKLGKMMPLERCLSSLAVNTQLKPKKTFTHTFVYAWNFPNQYNIKQCELEGNFYSNYFKNSIEVIEYLIQNRSELYTKTFGFVENFFDSTLNPVFLNQISSHLNTFITSGFLNKKGDFGILEGMNPEDSCCGVATIDVSIYASPMICALFPELQKSTMRNHKNRQLENGLVLHSMDKDFSCCGGKCGDSGITDRLDLSGQFVMIVLRDYFWTDDKAYLDEMWPAVKKAIDHVIKLRDKNNDLLPDMEGIMSSYDNFAMFGDASYILSQWICAMRMAAEAAKIMDELDLNEKYSKIADHGRKVFEEKLWNGKYFRLYNSEIGKNKGVDEGCLTDQLIGQWFGHLTGFGELFNQAKVRKALQNIYDISYKPKFGLRNCSWPEDKFLHDVGKDTWVDQANTCWTGVELAFASFLLYEGMYQRAADIIKQVDSRYLKAGLYWNHQECGGHYYRPMSAWTILNASIGLSIYLGEYKFQPKIPQKYTKVFFAFPEGTAHFISGEKVEIPVLTGVWKPKKIILSGVLSQVENLKVTLDQKPIDAKFEKNTDTITITFSEKFEIKGGQKLEVG